MAPSYIINLIRIKTYTRYLLRSNEVITRNRLTTKTKKNEK